MHNNCDGSEQCFKKKNASNSFFMSDKKKNHNQMKCVN